ncbi:MAG TPA: hypothetical protein PLB59_11095 [Bacteroidales bacterium]|nr:hypothetical protein [Bacteroidales bacterium]HNZ42183.1 hypothetical protein [Bacteroidales bacterium]HPB24709.1 hypothetical protein [Bacteroidales bacterium]HPI30796.1 hypothetical protein [Bacteroidales bacterium]HQN15458.1 hypothetical protein [Bacteroidales bacterium]
MKKHSESKKMPDFEFGLYDSGRKTADMAVEAVGNDPERFALLVDMSFSKPYPLCMRAARVVQLCCEKNISLIMPWLDEVIVKICNSQVEGVKRNFLKIIDEFVDFELIKDNALLLQNCFDWLINPAEALGTRYYCIGIIEKFCRYEPELLGEFLNSLEFCLDEASAGFRNRAIKVLKKHKKSL